MSDTIAKGVAALANTYGGLLLVGVSDDRQVRGVKEKTIQKVAEHCAANIEPPFVPPIIPMPLGQGSDLYVLVHAPCGLTAADGAFPHRNSASSLTGYWRRSPARRSPHPWRNWPASTRSPFPNRASCIHRHGDRHDEAACWELIGDLDDAADVHNLARRDHRRALRLWQTIDDMNQTTASARPSSP